MKREIVELDLSLEAVTRRELIERRQRQRLETKATRDANYQRIREQLDRDLELTIKE